MSSLTPGQARRDCACTRQPRRRADQRCVLTAAVSRARAPQRAADGYMTGVLATAGARSGLERLGHGLQRAVEPRAQVAALVGQPGHEAGVAGSEHRTGDDLRQQVSCRLAEPADTLTDAALVSVAELLQREDAGPWNAPGLRRPLEQGRRAGRPGAVLVAAAPPRPAGRSALRS